MSASLTQITVYSSVLYPPASLLSRHCKVARTRAIKLQYNYNKITQKFCCIAAVRTSAIQLQYKFLQPLQVACKFSASCRKLVLQRCIAGVHTSTIQLQYKKKILVLQLYCTCADRLTKSGGWFNWPWDTPHYFSQWEQQWPMPYMIPSDRRGVPKSRVPSASTLMNVDQ